MVLLLIYSILASIGSNLSRLTYYWYGFCPDNELVPDSETTLGWVLSLLIVEERDHAPDHIVTDHRRPAHRSQELAGLLRVIDAFVPDRIGYVSPVAAAR